MFIRCLKCEKADPSSEQYSIFVRAGSFYRTSDAKWVQRFRCKRCLSSFSRATFNPCFRQKKRTKNNMLRKLLCSGVSQRRAAIILNLHRVTVVRKFLFLSSNSVPLKVHNAQVVEFDDLETFEHTKCKPLSVTLAVEYKTRKILGIEVSSMAAKGLLVGKARKYGPRLDERKSARRKLFLQIAPQLAQNCIIKSDQNPHYEADVKELLPWCEYKQYKGRRGASTGQGELKKIGFDPLFSLNHTCAKLRADINRLFRRTWCTTKKADRLKAHLILYAAFHNEQLLN
jgi:transposase-like protein